MTPKLREYNAPDRELAAWTRDVRRVLVDEAAQRVEFEYTIASVPLRITTPLKRPPSKTTIVSAIKRTAPTVIEAALKHRYTWLSGGVIEIAFIDVLSPAETYDVVIELEK